jgi:PAS domain S-box-containing protein/putative nucleotidyltransferase with HDIG domain
LGKRGRSKMKFKSSVFADQAIQPLLDSFSSNIAILDEQGTIILVNQAWCDFGKANGYLDKEFGLGQNYLSLCDSIMGIGAEEAHLVAEGIRKVLAKEVKEEYVDYPCHSPNEKRWFRVKIAPFEYQQKYIILTHSNISRNKSIEENLFESENLFKRVIEQSAEGVSIIDEDGKIIEWNQAEERITGRRREDIIGRYIWDVQSESRPGKPSQKFVEMMKKNILVLLESGTSAWAGKPSEVIIIKPDGTQVTIESVIFAIKHNHGFFACSIDRDVTELINTKKARQLLEKRFQTYLNNSPAIAMIIKGNGDFIDVNPQACLKLGFSQTELLSMNIAQLIPSGETEKSRELFELLKKEQQASSEIKVSKKDGGIILLHSNAVVLPDGLMMILSNDITELKEIQSKLQESETFLTSILDNIPSMITVKEAATLKYFKVNRPVEEYLGKPSHKILGKTVYDLFSNGEARFYSEQDELTLKEKQILDIPVENGVSIDHQPKFFHEKKIPMYDAEGNPRYILSISEDITDQIRLENDSKARLERLEAIGKLSTRMQAPATLDEMLPVILDIFLETIRAPMGSIWIYNQDRDELVPVYYTGGGHDNRLLVNEPLKPGQGIPGMVYVTREPHITQNYNEDPWFNDYKRGLLHDPLGGVTLPLRTSNNVIGVINISTTFIRVFTDDDVKLLTTLSEIAGNAIQTITLKEQTEQRLMRLSALSSIDRAISSSFDMMVSFEILVSNVISQLKMDAADVLLYNPHSQLLEYSTGQGFMSNVIKSACLRLGESLAGKAAVTREMVVVKNLADANISFAIKDLAVEGFVSYYGVPLVAKGELRGVLEVFSRTQHTPDDDWLNFLKSLAEQAAIAIDNTEMFENLRRSNMELGMAYNATIEGWSRALDLRDKETEGHTLRVTEITERLVRAFDLPQNEIKYIRWGALLHDIGKMGVPDGILLKPGPLTEEEWVVMRMHPKYAFEMLAPIGYLTQAIDIPYCHHEKWDGTGYPRGLKGEQIPLSARIFALVDIWDALGSDRPYRKAWPHEKIIEHIRSLSGTHLDPKVVDFCLSSGIFTDKTI